MHLPKLGLGTWHMGESTARRAVEVAALRTGLDLGAALIDTAEMYGDGGAEEVVGLALRGRHDAVQVVSKFYPHNASKKRLPLACHASLRRLGIDRIDLYLLHWRGSVPLAETVEALERLVSEGAIARWGVSNFDVDDLRELRGAVGGNAIAANQVLYNAAHRGIEFDLLPACQDAGIDVMAYSPLDEGPLPRHPVIASIAKRLGVSGAQVCLAWLLRNPGVCVIPKAGTDAHVRENLAAETIRLDAQTLAEIDVAFPPPHEALALEVI